MGMLDPGRFLVACPHCEAWPMAANVKRSTWSASPLQIRFVCPRCRREETAVVSASGELTPVRRVDIPPPETGTAAARLRRPRGRA